MALVVVGPASTTDKVTVVHNDITYYVRTNAVKKFVAELKPPHYSLSIGDKSNLTYKVYYEETDQEMFLPLSKQFLDRIKKLGWTIVYKVGQGSTQSAFLAYNQDQLAVLLVSHDISISKSRYGYKTIDYIVGLTNYVYYFNQIYEGIKLDIPPADFEATSSQILVVEYLPYTIKEYLKLNPTVPKKLFLSYLRRFLLQAQSYFNSNNLEYTDVKLGNIAIGYKDGLTYFKFIDAQDAHIRESDNDEIFGLIDLASKRIV